MGLFFTIVGSNTVIKSLAEEITQEGFQLRYCPSEVINRLLKGVACVVDILLKAIAGVVEVLPQATACLVEIQMDPREALSKFRARGSRPQI